MAAARAWVCARRRRCVCYLELTRGESWQLHERMVREEGLLQQVDEADGVFLVLACRRAL